MATFVDANPGAISGLGPNECQGHASLASLIDRRQRRLLLVHPSTSSPGRVSSPPPSPPTHSFNYSTTLAAPHSLLCDTLSVDSVQPSPCASTHCFAPQIVLLKQATRPVAFHQAEARPVKPPPPFLFQPTVEEPQTPSRWALETSMRYARRSRYLSAPSWARRPPSPAWSPACRRHATPALLNSRTPSSSRALRTLCTLSRWS